MDEQIQGGIEPQIDVQEPGIDLSENSGQVAEPQIENGQVSQEPNQEPNQNPNPGDVQTPEMNSQFASIRRRAEQEGRDKFIANQGYEWNGKPIKTEAEYNQALKEYQMMEYAKQNNVDPQFYMEFQSMKEKLHGMEREKTISEQERQFLNDEFRSPIYSEYKDGIHEMADTYGVDIKTAYDIYVSDNLETIINNATQKAVNDALRGVNQNQNTPGGLGSTSETPKISYSNMSDEEFEKHMQKALNGELMNY